MFGGCVGELEDAQSLASGAAGQPQLICHFAEQQLDDVALRTARRKPCRSSGLGIVMIRLDV